VTNWLLILFIVPSISQVRAIRSLLREGVCDSARLLQVRGHVRLLQLRPFLLPRDRVVEAHWLALDLAGWMVMAKDTTLGGGGNGSPAVMGVKSATSDFVTLAHPGLRFDIATR